ncbi:MAG: 3-hydroxyacyl-ACP dehydratase FabZ [Alphaproteobacteria bacterium]|nr:3-hydroxyacyl-ACP dehydratase FabZ [Alphaproteobacteria bacterium]
MSTIEPGKTELSAKEILKLLPHRYPMLLIDRIVDIVPGESAVAIKNVTMNEPFFPGHFPDYPVMPGVMIIEAMAQGAAAFTAYGENLDTEGKVVLFMGIEKAKFRRPILPGDQVRISIRVAHRRPPVWRFEGEAHVDGKLVTSATYSAMLANATI